MPTKDEVAIAAQNGDLRVLRAARSKDLRQKDPEYGNTPLIWAADAGETAVVSYLIDEGVDVNVQGLVGNTALARACRHGHRKIVQALLAVPDIDPNKANDKLQYPRHHAA